MLKLAVAMSGEFDASEMDKYGASGSRADDAPMRVFGHKRWREPVACHPLMPMSVRSP
jgi:hypothetical protein